MIEIALKEDPELSARDSVRDFGET